MWCWTTSTPTSPSMIAGWHVIPTSACTLRPRMPVGSIKSSVWFSILSRRALRGVSFTSPQQVRDAIDHFIAVYNDQAVPFEWTKREIRNVHPRPYYANLRN